MANPQRYSGTSLPKKLGFVPGSVVCAQDAPDNDSDVLNGAVGDLKILLLPLGWVDPKVCAGGVDGAGLKSVERKLGKS